MQEESVAANSKRTADDENPVSNLLLACGAVFGDELTKNLKKKKETDEKGSAEISHEADGDNEAFVSAGGTSIRNQIKPDERYSCENCNKKFTKKAEYMEHVFEETGKHRYKCEHENCNWSFKTKYKLERHQIKHGAEKKFVCPVENCNKSYAESYKLKSHVHTHLTFFQCQVAECDAIFSTERGLQNHKKKIHHPKKKTHGRFVCTFPDCGQLFSRKSYLDVHIRSHTNERPFKCSFKDCHATFTSASKFNRHQMTHVEAKPFECKYEGCLSSFKRQDNLNQHIRMHHTENKAFFCPFEGCESRFSAVSSLKDHICLHTKETFFVCPLEGCTKSYYSKNVLRTHLRRHQAKIEKEEKLLQEQEIQNKLCNESLNLRLSDHNQHIDISLNEVLIPAMDDVTGLLNPDNASAPLDPENTVVALGEAVCFQYMNAGKDMVSLDISNPEDGIVEVNEKSYLQRCSRETVVSSHPHITTNPFQASTTSNENFGKSNISSKSQENGLKPDNVNMNSPVFNPTSTVASQTTESRSVEISPPIFSSGSVAVPLSMTRFLPRDIQVNELFQHDYPNDHAYNRSLLPTVPRTSVTLENRNIDTAIENALTSSSYEGSLSVSGATDSIMEMRSFLVENGMSSFLANDDVGRMETCSSEDQLNINRNYDSSRDINNAMMLEESTIDNRSSSLDSGFNHYSSNDSYVVSLMESSHVVSEHLLNISHNPTMVDHMYSQQSPEEVELQIASEEQNFEESTVNIQDIR